MNGPRSCDSNEIGRAVYLGDIPSCVAGWYFHAASALPGERVSLVREPGNPHGQRALIGNLGNL